MAEISVIVPVYNVEPYLENCIESIVNQTFRDFELLLIDDGSDDKSRFICDTYAAKDERIVVFHQEHGGVSAGRNKGIRESRSEYIAFVDADDYVDSKYLETLYRTMKKYRADLVLSDAVDVWQEPRPKQGQKSDDFRSKRAEIVSRAEAYRRMFLCIHTSVTLWANLYHRRVFQDIRFPEGEIHEETKVLNRLIENCERIVCIPYKGYYWRIRKGSLMHGGTASEKYTAVKNAKHLWDFMGEHYPDVEDAARIFYVNTCLQSLNRIICNQERAYEKKCRILRGKIIRESVFFLLNSHSRMVEKGAVVCIGLGIPFYRQIFRFYLQFSGKEAKMIRRDRQVKTCRKG